MHRVGVQLAEEGHEIGDMGSDRVVLPRVRPGSRAMVAQRVGDEAVLRGDGLALRLPVAEVHPRPVHENHGRTSALVNVGQIDAVHPELGHHRLLSLVSAGAPNAI